MKSFGILLLSFALLANSWAKPPKTKKKFGIDFLKHNWALIPAGKVKINNEEINMPSFYMAKSESSNLDYLEFLKDLKSQGKEADYQKALPDTTVWLQKDVPVNLYATDYLRYPGFRGYPVVGLSHEAAQMYADWLGAAINKLLDGSAKVSVRLPTEAEWVRAARGDLHEQVYPWVGNELRNKKGRLNANFADENKAKLGTVVENVIILDDVWGGFKKPNQFGITNLAGNAAEMLAEKGKTKGGSWNSNSEAIKIAHTETQNVQSAFVGMRLVLTVIN
jgi:formylglycine-generating enzyme required for sulfatase activity